MNTPAFSRFLSGEPYFLEVPEVPPVRIFGSENELGVTSLPDGDENPSIGVVLSENDHDMPQWLTNGGRMYIDLQHPEVAIPETGNALSATVYTRAMMKMAHKVFGDKYLLYANNCDWGDETSQNKISQKGNSFGSHESYSTSSKPEFWYALAPFLVARTIITGAGRVTNEGKFELSQRANFVTTLSTSNTQQLGTEGRGIICLRNYPVEECERNKRLHLILGDSNLNQTALFLKFAITGLLIDLMEMGVLPELEWEPEVLVIDLQMLSFSARDWLREPIKNKSSLWDMLSFPAGNALDLLWQAYHFATRYLGGRDEVTDAALTLWAEVMAQLEDPETHLDKLARRSDWAAKVWLIRRHLLDVGATTDGTLCGIDMQYHALNGEGLQEKMEEVGLADKIFSSAMLETAMKCPPGNTRASFRGWLAEKFPAGQTRKGYFFVRDHSHKNWGVCTLSTSGGHSEVYHIPNPHDEYPHHKSEVLRLLRSMQ